MSHTHGPWVIHNDGKPLFGEWCIRQDPKDWDGAGYQAICSMPAATRGSLAGDMFAANAKLIAAAPDLLYTLKMVAGKIRSGDDRADDTFVDFNGEEADMIFHAILKAT